MEADTFGSRVEGEGFDQPEPGTSGPTEDTGGGQSKPKRESRKVIDPRTIPKARTTPKPKRKKGRPPGAKATGAKETGDATGARKASTATSLNFGEMIHNAHIMLAVIARNEMLELTEAEANKLGNALERVTELYQVPFLDERSRAWINLGMVGFEVYGTRVIATMAEKRRKPATVTPIRHTPHPTPPGQPTPPVEGYVEGVVINAQS